jgi:DNA-3-methyladenine glycosylase I
MTRADLSSSRCPWCGSDPLYVAYHDKEWGVPVTSDQDLFEKLILDGFQAGLAWITILRKREAFREAFHHFDPERIARYTERDVDRLMANEGIIRSRLKITGTIKNAKLYLDVMEAGKGAFRDLLWKHVDHATRINRLRTLSDCPAETAESKAMAKDLKKRGFTFCGPTICYAFMQAVGMVNDHLVTCPRYEACAKKARR